MNAGRPRTVIGTYGTVGIRSRARGYIPTARYRVVDGRLRPATASGASRSAAKARLKERLLIRSGYGSRGILALTSAFRDLVALWLANLEKHDLVERTEVNYCDALRLHIMPAFEHFTPREITTGRVE